MLNAALRQRLAQVEIEKGSLVTLADQLVAISKEYDTNDASFKFFFTPIEDAEMGPEDYTAELHLVVKKYERPATNDESDLDIAE